MFRIDRRFVKLTANSARRRGAEDETLEADAGDDFPEDAAAFANTAVMSDEEAQEAANRYLIAAEHELEMKTTEILNETRIKADAIMEKAQKDAELLKKVAYEDGYADGERAIEQRLAEMREQDEQILRSTLQEIAREREKIESELEEDTVALAVEVVRKIIGPAEEELGNVYMSLIKNALRQLSGESKYTIRVSPTEYERFFSKGAGEITLDSGDVVKVSVLRDVSLEENDLIIDTEEMTVNAGVETQLKYVTLAFQSANQYEPEQL